MSAMQPVNPHYGSGQVVTPAVGAASVPLNAVAKQVILTNLGAAVCYVRIGAGAQVATTADYPIPSGAQCVVTKADGHDTLSHISAAGTSLHVMDGEGW